MPNSTPISPSEGTETGMDPRQWMQSTEYLPEFLRDFHDQKDFFKALSMTFKATPELEFHTWVSNHIFTVDHFLWFCGIHGYTLQKSRKKGVAFEDIHAKVAEKRAAWRAALPSLMALAAKPIDPESLTPPGEAK